MKINKLVLWVSLVALALLLAPNVLADVNLETIGDVAIYRIAPAQAPLGQKIWVTFILENGANAKKDIGIVERVGDADFDKTEATSIETPYGEVFWYYEWKIELPAKGNTTISYWLIPKTVGTYVISPARVDVDGDVSYLEARSIEIKCVADGKCDSEAGENYLTCPEDCTTGRADGICDYAADGRCDPDCEPAADPDCEAAAGNVTATPAPTPTAAVTVAPTPTPLPAQGGANAGVIAGAVVGVVLIGFLGYLLLRRRGRAQT